MRWTLSRDIQWRVGSDGGAALGSTAQIYGQADDRDCRRDHQVRVEAAMRDGLSADQGTKRDPQKEGAVVPGQNGRTAGGELVRKSDLLSREEQLCHRRQEPERAADEHSGIERETQQEKAQAETSQSDRARQQCPKPVRHAPAYQDAT